MDKRIMAVWHVENYCHQLEEEASIVVVPRRSFASSIFAFISLSLGKTFKLPPHPSHHSLQDGINKPSCKCQDSEICKSSCLAAVWRRPCSPTVSCQEEPTSLLSASLALGSMQHASYGIDEFDGA